MLTKSFNGGWRKTTHCPHRKVIVLHPLDTSPGEESTIRICRKGRRSTDLEHMWVDSPHNCPRCKIECCPLLKEVDNWLI
jgi:hypothetical protein